MNPEPLEHNELPAYPTRDELRADHGLLDRRLPRAWKLGRDFAGAVALFMAANCTGCGAPSTPAQCQPASLSGPTDAEKNETLGRGRWSELLQVLQEVEWESAVQQYGPDPIVGMASEWIDSLLREQSPPALVACVAITPPVFLPEDEAKRVIEENSDQG